MSKHLVLAIGASLSAFAGSAFGTDAPTLDHTAPFLGGDLTIELGGAPPGAAIRLFVSPAAEDSGTPYGTLELLRAEVSVMAVGSADGSGSWTHVMPLPQGAAIAESEVHLQALVVDASFAAGAMLSEAIHLRLLGTRVYAGHRGDDFGGGVTFPAGLTIVSAVHDSVVAELDFGAPAPAGSAMGDGLPVFSANVARGAVMPSPFELRVFDPFFGQAIGALPFQEASRTLHIDSTGERVLVLETGLELGTPARIHTVELETATVVGTLDLPSTATGIWLVDDTVSNAYVAEFLPGSGRTAVRRVDLALMEVRETVPVGWERSRLFLDMALDGARVFVSTRSPFGASAVHGEFSVVDFAAGPSLEVDLEPGSMTQRMCIAGAVNALYTFERDPFTPTAGLGARRLTDPLVPLALPQPWVYLYVTDMEQEDLGLWVLDAGGNEPPTGSEVGRLYFFDASTTSWTQYPTVWASDAGPLALEVARDGLVDKLFLANDLVGPVGFQDPELFILDRLTSAESGVPIGVHPDALRAVPVP